MTMRCRAIFPVLGVIVATLSGSAASMAQIPAGDERGQFRFEFKEIEGARGLGVEGWVHNDLRWRVTGVQLRVECVDSNGAIIASATGWVLGDVMAGGRGYFYVPVPTRAAGYRVSVQSFDKVSRAAPEAP